MFHKADFVFIDFEINALRDLPPLETMKQYGYTLLRTESTHIMHGLLDHAYIRNNAKVTPQTQPVYYSDQDALILNW